MRRSGQESKGKSAKKFKYPNKKDDINGEKEYWLQIYPQLLTAFLEYYVYSSIEIKLLIMLIYVITEVKKCYGRCLL